MENNKQINSTAESLSAYSKYLFRAVDMTESKMATYLRFKHVKLFNIFGAILLCNLVKRKMQFSGNNHNPTRYTTT